MNPGEHNQAPRGNNSRYFGNRPRRTGNTRRFNAPQTSTSQYFNQQAPALTPTPPPTAYQEPKRKRSKKPFIIGALVLAIIAIVVIVAVTLVPKAVETVGKNSNFDELLNTIATYSGNVNYCEMTVVKYENSKANRIPFNNDAELSESQKQTINDNVAKVSEFREKLNEYGGITKQKDEEGKEHDINEILNTLKKTLDERIKYYKKYAEIYSAILDINIKQGKDGTIDNLQTVINTDKGQELANILRDYYDTLNDFKNKDCGSKSSSECKDLNFQTLKKSSVIVNSTLLNEILRQESIKQDEVGNPILIMGELELIGRSRK